MMCFKVRSYVTSVFLCESRRQCHVNIISLVVQTEKNS